MLVSLFVNPCSSAIDHAERLDMAGNTDWIRVDLKKSVAEMLLNGDIRDDHGASLFKWDGAEVQTRTAEERMREWGEEIQQPTLDERMTNAEGQIAGMSSALDIIIEGRMPE